MATTNSIAAYNFMKSNYGKEFTKAEVAKALGIPQVAVTGAFTPHLKAGRLAITREEIVELEPATETRKAKTRKDVYITMTEDGLAYDPVEEDARKAAEKEAAKAERAAAKAAAKAAKEEE